MSITGHRNRLEGLRPTHRSKMDQWWDEWLKALHAHEREQKAALAMVEVAQALAGTVMQPRTFGGSAPPQPVAAAPRAAPPIREPGPRWTKTVRPGPHDVLDPIEALQQVPWINGNEED